MLSFLGRGKGGGESGGVGSASDPSSAAPRPDAPASNLAGADAVEISLQATLEGHTDRVWCVAWEPQGRSLATCSSDKTVRLWAPSRAAGGAWVTVAELEGVHNRTVRSVAWSPCGRLLATASFDASTAVWAQQGGEWECVAVVEGHENEVKSCAWSPSGQLLATCGRDKSVWIWELQPGHDFECVAVLNGHAQDVKQVVWHPTEDVLVSVSYDDTVKVWTEDPGGDDWSCTVTVGAKEGGHESTVWSAAFEAGTGRRMVTCSDDRTLGVWEAKGLPNMTVSPLFRFPSGHDRPTISVAWGACGVVAAGGGDNSLRCYAPAPNDPTQWRQIGAVEGAHEDDVNCVAWHPKETHSIATCSDDGSVKIWSVAPADARMA